MTLVSKMFVFNYYVNVYNEVSLQGVGGNKPYYTKLVNKLNGKADFSEKYQVLYLAKHYCLKSKTTNTPKTCVSYQLQCIYECQKV